MYTPIHLPLLPVMKHLCCAPSLLSFFEIQKENFPDLLWPFRHTEFTSIPNMLSEYNQGCVSLHKDDVCYYAGQGSPQKIILLSYNLGTSLRSGETS